MKRSSLLFALLCAGPFVTAAPIPLFDGHSLEGWEGDAKLWRVEDGMITGGSLTEKVTHNDFIATVRSFQNFDLHLKIKLSGTDGFINSGVQIRSVRIPGSSEMYGYQVDYGKGWYGKLYDESRRNKVLGDSTDPAAATAAIHEADWNEYHIHTEGGRIQSWINGVPALDYTEADPTIALDGKIGIQIHGGGKALVQVKDVVIDELPPTPGAPTWESVGGYEGVKAKYAKPAAPAKPAADATKQTATGRDISYNSVASGAKTPAEELATFTVAPGFEVQLVAAEDVAKGFGKFVPLVFDQQGRIWTTTAFEYPVDGNENPAAADALYSSHAKDKVLVYDRDPSQPTGYATTPRVFADGLAIPLGVLPYKDGCYVLHGHDIELLHDTDGDGKADKREVILTGFGVQDSHLFPHQFTRAPGNWIWMAQGAFNYGKVRQPNDPPEKAVQFDQTRMAKFHPDGSGFDITSNGPCNIWGLVLNGEGEAFIQEANDFGYPVMPFHEYANYPGCSSRQWKSYAPEFPGTAPDFRMGGTGLSGLALTDAKGPFPEHWRDVMLAANPITNRIQGIKMHRDGPRWKLDPPEDLLVSSDPWFRPVATTMGPDGCLYIVDWYNKIISHNEVPRNHPDRDKTRGRIWRVKPIATKAFEVPDFTKLSDDQLIGKLDGDSLAQSHLAWQTLEDHIFAAPQDKKKILEEKLLAITKDRSQSVAKRIQALWADWNGVGITELAEHIEEELPNFRREIVTKLGTDVPGSALYDELKPVVSDTDPTVRAEALRACGNMLSELRDVSPVSGDDHGSGTSALWAMERMLSFDLQPLTAPTAPSTFNGKPIKVREAYDREFERYLVRMFLERHPVAVAEFLDTTDPEKPSPARVSVEARLLATLALEPKASASRVAKLLPQLQRAPGQEEVLRLAQFPEEPGVGDALKVILQSPATRTAALESLFAMRTKLDGAKLAPFLTDAAKALVAGNDAASIELGAKLAAGFKLTAVEPGLVALLSSPETKTQLTALHALGELRSGQAEVFSKLAESSPDAAVRDEALATLAVSPAADAPQRVLTIYPKLASVQRRHTLEKLSSTKPGATAIVAALSTDAIAKTDLDSSTLDRLQAVLGTHDPVLTKLVDSLGGLFRPVLALDGSDDAWTQTNVTLDGPCTIETWVKLDPEGRGISNADGILGAPGQLDLNFFGAKLRAYAFPPLNDVVVSKKPLTPGLWTHVALTRSVNNQWKIYIDGELDVAGTKPAPGKIENPRIGWTTAKGGTQGALGEFRIWNCERTADEIRAASNRTLPANTPNLVFTSATDWGKLQAGAKVIKTSDFPPIVTADEAIALDAKYAKNRALANQPGDANRGKLVAAVCQACHLMGTTGGNIGPNLSGVGAMGTEAILRNILEPSAAMENGYRIYRVELRNGDLVDALYVSEDKDALVVRMPGSDDRRIAKADIRETKYLRRSLMPEGLLDGFTPQQVSDLFAFLRTLK